MAVSYYTNLILLETGNLKNFHDKIFTNMSLLVRLSNHFVELVVLFFCYTFNKCESFDVFYYFVLLQASLGAFIKRFDNV